MSLLDNARKEAGHLFNVVQPEFQTIAALVWRDTKAISGSVAEAAEKLGASDLGALKEMAFQVVRNTENDPNFKSAKGSWKMGHTCMILASQLGKGLLTNLPKLEQDTIETLIQTVFASMVTLS